MPGSIIVRRFLLPFIAVLALAGPTVAETIRVRATIDTVAATSLQVTTRAGAKQIIALTASTIIVAIVPIKLEDIKPGSFIGSAAMPQPDGTQRALEVHVFPESMRGTGEGHRPFDLQPQSTMTNGSVGSVTGSVGRTLTVSYQGGEKTIVVPPDTPIVTYEPGSSALLVPNAHVIVMATEAADGVLTATRVSVGKDGLVPPM